MSEDRLQQALPKLALLLAVILLAGSAYLAWHNTQLLRTNTAMSPTAEINPAIAEHPQLEKKLLLIPKWHLFGQARKASQNKPQQAHQKAPETRLKLTLKGVAKSNDITQAHAIIAAPGKGEDSYVIGDELPGNATLHAIESHRVLLDRNGRIEALSLPQPKPGSTITLID